MLANSNVFAGLTGLAGLLGCGLKRFFGNFSRFHDPLPFMDGQCFHARIFHTISTRTFFVPKNAGFKAVK
jgi:hypothetical protein